MTDRSVFVAIGASSIVFVMLDERKYVRLGTLALVLAGLNVRMRMISTAESWGEGNW